MYEGEFSLSLLNHLDSLSNTILILSHSKLSCKSPQELLLE